jgi:alpha-glucosidase (family GH31 glycosyl hydrolase)
MAWFHRERGELARAKFYLELAETAAVGGEKSALPAIVAEQLAGTSGTGVPAGSRSGSGGSASVRFLHDPVGGECPYFAGNNERSPRVVTYGDPVVIRTFAEPFGPGAEIWLEYAVDGERPVRLRMEAARASNGEPFWQATIPPCPDCAQVSYRFVAKEEKSEIVSEAYTYPVLRWVSLNAAAETAVSARGLTVRFEPPVPDGPSPVLRVSDEDHGGIRCRLSMEEREASEGADRPAAGGAFAVGAAEVAASPSSFALRLRDPSGRVLTGAGETGGLPFAELLTDRSGRAYKLRLNFALREDEKLYGAGERFARLNLRGCEPDHYVFNQYKDQGLRTYMPVPFLVSSAGYGFFLDSARYSVFRIATVRPDLLQIEADMPAEEQAIEWRLFRGKPLEVIEQFTRVTGKPKLPPKWAFGPWMSSNNWDSEREVVRQLERTIRHRIPATVMVLEQWSDEATFYIFNDAMNEVKPGGERFTYGEFTFPAWGRWPDPKGLVARIHDAGIRVLLWQAPVMKYMDGIRHPQMDEDERFMIGRGFAVRNADGSPYRIPHYEWFRGSLVPDFTNPEATEWWLGKRRYLLEEVGIDGFKTDGGECIYGSDVRFHDGRRGAEMRNAYPKVYVKAFHEYANRFVQGGAVTFSRAGYTGAQATPLHWAGDERSTFAAFRASIIAGLSSGISGIPFWGWDLGGFSGEIPTAELYNRAVQMAAFCPVMQYHAESKGQFNLDRTPWNIAERTGKPEVLALYKKFADLRMNLLPYIYEQAKISASKGWPLMRAMAVSYPDDPACAELSLQYMFGDSLLVAPVTEEGAEQIDVYLPHGRWLPLFGGAEAVDGGRRISVRAPLSDTPVFVGPDSVIPLNLGADCRLADEVGNATDRYVRLTFMIHPVGNIIAYRFDDGMGDAVELSAVRNRDRVEASVRAEAPCTLLFCIPEKARRVEVDGRPWEPALEAPELAEGKWVQRDGEVLLLIEPGKAKSRSIVILAG